MRPALDAGHRMTYSLGDVICSTNATVDLRSGELLETTTFYPNGGRETHRSSTKTSFPVESSGFTGKEEDEDVCLTYFGERWLIPRIARWSSPDPMSIHAAAGGEVGNAYHYVAGNLLQGRDPLGLEEDDSAEVPGPEEVRQEAIAVLNRAIQTARTAQRLTMIRTGRVEGQETQAMRDVRRETDRLMKHWFPKLNPRTDLRTVIRTMIEIRERLRDQRIEIIDQRPDGSLEIPESAEGYRDEIEARRRGDARAATSRDGELIWIYAREVDPEERASIAIHEGLHATDETNMDSTFPKNAYSYQGFASELGGAEFNEGDVHANLTRMMEQVEPRSEVPSSLVPLGDQPGSSRYRLNLDYQRPAPAPDPQVESPR